MTLGTRLLPNMEGCNAQSPCSKGLAVLEYIVLLFNLVIAHVQ